MLYLNSWDLLQSYQVWKLFKTLVSNYRWAEADIARSNYIDFRDCKAFDYHLDLMRLLEMRETKPWVLNLLGEKICPGADITQISRNVSRLCLSYNV